MEPFIFLEELDSAFDVPWQAYQELRHRRLLDVTHEQVCTLQRVRGNHLVECGRFERFHEFCRTFADCARICAASAMGCLSQVKPVWQGPLAFERNCKNRCDDKHIDGVRGSNFATATVHSVDLNKLVVEDAERYLQAYDRFYPYHVMVETIEKQQQLQQYGQPVDLSRKMLIFWPDLREVVEVCTTATVTDLFRERESERFRGSIRVKVTRALVRKSEFDGECVKKLREDCRMLARLAQKKEQMDYGRQWM